MAHSPLTTRRPAARPVRRPRRGAFTLTELLVVLAVVGVLASLLVPVFGRAREKVRLAMCRANLRALGAGLNAYVAARRTHMPVAEKLDNPHPALVGALYDRFVGDPETFYCPSLTQENICWSPANFAARRIGYYYFCCRRATANRAVSTFLRWDVAWPRILDTRMESDAWVASDIWIGGEPTAHSWYPKAVNYLTLGGEVRMITRRPRGAFR